MLPTSVSPRFSSLQSILQAPGRTVSFSAASTINHGPSTDKVLFAGNADKPSAAFVLRNINKATNWRLDTVGGSDYANPECAFDIDGKTYQIYKHTFPEGERHYLQRGWESSMDAMPKPVRISEAEYRQIKERCLKLGSKSIHQYFGYRPGEDVKPWIRAMATNMLALLDDPDIEPPSYPSWEMGGYSVGDLHHEVKERGDRFTLHLPSEDGHPKNVSFYPWYEEDTNTISGYTIRLHDAERQSRWEFKQSYAFSVSDVDTINTIQLLSKVSQHFDIASFAIIMRSQGNDNAAQETAQGLQRERQNLLSELQN
jgi:hypothetical protein